MKAWFLRTVYFGLPVLLLVITFAAMNTGTILKRPMGQDDHVVASLQAVLSHAVSGEWEAAGATMKEAHQAWKKVRGRVLLTSATEEIELFDLELAGLEGAIEGRDDAQARIAIHRLMALWDDLGS